MSIEGMLAQEKEEDIRFGVKLPAPWSDLERRWIDQMKYVVGGSENMCRMTFNRERRRDSKTRSATKDNKYTTVESLQNDKFSDKLANFS